MTTSYTGRVLIQGFEGLRTSAYLDSVGIATIGYGHIAGVKMGDTCTKEQAENWLTQDLKTAEDAVNKYVTVPLTQNQFDALASWTYNLGAGNFKNSTMLKVLNDGDYAQAATEMLKWDKAAGKPVAGLTSRRQSERALFLKPASA